MGLKRTAVAALVVIGAAATACGAGTETVSTGAVVRAAVVKTTSSAGATVTMSAKVQGQDLFSGEFSGSQDGTTGSGWLKMPALDQTIKFQNVGGTLYYAFPNLTTGKKWVQLTDADLQTIGIDEASLQQQQSKQVLDLLKEASDQVTNLGNGVVDGHEATHYRAIVRAKDLAANGKLSGPAAASLGLFGPTTPFDVWIGTSDGRLRRITYSIDLSKSTNRPKGFPSHGSLDYRIDISDYGDVPTPTAPPADQIMSFSDLQALAASAGTN